jgi:hypothetical protein
MAWVAQLEIRGREKPFENVRKQPKYCINIRAIHLAPTERSCRRE